MALALDVYAQPVELTVKQLEVAGFDLAKLHESTWQGRPVYVVGAAAGATRSPGSSGSTRNGLYFVRLVEPGKQNPTARVETQFNKYIPMGQGWLRPPSRRIDSKTPSSPKTGRTQAPGRQPIVPGAALPQPEHTGRLLARGCSSTSRVGEGCPPPANRTIHERFDFLDTIEDSLELHPVPLPLGVDGLCTLPSSQRSERDAPLDRTARPPLLFYHHTPCKAGGGFGGQQGGCPRSPAWPVGPVGNRDVIHKSTGIPCPHRLATTHKLS